MKKAEKTRAEPRKGRKPKPAPRAAKAWTPEEDAFLQDKWGDPFNSDHCQAVRQERRGNK